jgi:hypothetical protein
MLIKCTGCKGHACQLGQHQGILYYDKPFWFCYNCIGCATIDETGITPGILPECPSPTVESYLEDLKKFGIKMGI